MKIVIRARNKKKDTPLEVEKYHKQVENPIPEVTLITKREKGKEESKKRVGKIQEKLEKQAEAERAKNSVKKW